MSENAKDKSVILSIRGLKKSFGDLEVLKGVDLDIQNGEKIVLLGPSGCGKSMTLKSVAGIVDPDKGIISLKTNEETTYFDSDNNR